MSGSARFPDVVVIGGGIIGAACGYYLAREGVSVYLLERSSLASGSSGACEGNLLAWDKELTRELPLGRRSFQLWRELVDELEVDFEYQPKGSVMVAEDEQSLAAVEQKVRDLAAAGVPGRMLDPKQLHEEEPALAGDLVGGALFPEDGQVEPRYATAAMVEGGRRHGMVVRQDCPVRHIALSPEGRVEAVETVSGRIPTAAVVVAAGVWSRDIVATAGLDVPVPAGLLYTIIGMWMASETSLK
ncbi:MAG TPA: FAD-dependent oxidoreductase [Chloroflexota bacterium]|nr:FAD-dependent oxidoreductase [Chloroflexota bacterium]